jgi:hypothetical protein
MMQGYEYYSKYKIRVKDYQLSSMKSGIWTSVPPGLAAMGESASPEYTWHSGGAYALPRGTHSVMALLPILFTKAGNLDIAVQQVGLPLEQRTLRVDVFPNLRGECLITIDDGQF